MFYRKEVKMSDMYILIVQTDQYTGNFERELCAYCTGVIGQCEVGDKQRAMFIKDYDEEKADAMWELLEQRADDNGCLRPVSMCSPGNKNLEIYFNDRPTQEIIDMIKERAEKFTQEKDWRGKPRTMKILGFQMIKESTTTEVIKL